MRSPALKQWLLAPSVDSVPEVTSLTPSEISRVLSTVSGRGLGSLVSSFWDEAVPCLVAAVTNPNRSQSDVVSSIHVVDRIAACGLVSDRIDPLIRGLTRVPLKLNKTDAFIAARAGLLLGYPEMASQFLTVPICKSLEFSNLVQLASLATLGPLGSVAEELVQRLDKGDAVHSASSSDLVAACRAVGGVQGTSTTRALKRAGTELTRRIELESLSVFSCVDLIELFSGLPPYPIRPTLLQACYATLLVGSDSLSPADAARVLHAMALSEIENIVLTRVLVNVVLKGGMGGDPRIAYRAIAGVSLLKSFLPSSVLRALTCNLPVMASVDDQAVLITATVNLLGTGGLCPSAVGRFITCLDLNRLDDDSVAAVLLVAAYMSSLPKVSCRVPVNQAIAVAIPTSALEITEKANPALPNNKLKKKRLAQRAIARASSLGFNTDASFETRECVKCVCVKAKHVWPVAEAVLRLSSAAEMNEGMGRDVLSGLVCIDELRGFTVKELVAMDRLLDRAIAAVDNGEKRALPFDDETRKYESSVVRSLRSVGYPDVRTPEHVIGNYRVTCLLSVA